MAALPVTAFSPDKKHSDRERWICIYPAYINSKKTIAGGRRVPKDKAVENPTYLEIKDVLTAAGGIKFGVENKLYPRETSKEVLYRGRIRVQLKDDNGKPLNPDFPTRESVMLHLCNMIPKLKTRQGKQGGEQGSHSTQSGAATKKKGKGRR
ncbi:signal recognition particle 19 kDa protein [Cimex lectularius]|uniref:Signal recognition particle 19 kDa protein n=1 Tax=Cimex lectularius TaxID=79782 RepID=A0A8I6RVP3_CIMLE|nr:signal recognition particle 19 kDa protein [Cimex lectularius]